MIKTVSKVLKKILNKIEKVNSKINFKYIQFPESTFLLGNTNIDFRMIPENRIYVDIGSYCMINANFTFETQSGNVHIGNNVHMGGVHFICRSEIEIGDDVTMAWGIVLYDHDSHSVDWCYRMKDNNQCYHDYVTSNGNNIVNKDWSHVKTKKIKIESKVWMGFDVTVLKGVTIGEGSVIAAKSVVTRDVPPWSLAAGNPARIVKKLL